MAARWDTLSVDGSDLRAYLTLPDGAAPSPGVLVCMHAPGVDAFIQGVCDRLAGEGFAAVAPDLYHRMADPDPNPLVRMTHLRDAEILRDLDAAAGHLRGLDEVAADRTGVIGFCMGGRLAYLFAAHDSAVRASVVFYGGNIMVPWGEGRAPFEQSARIGCPVLGLFGDDDQNPSPGDVSRIDAELTRLDKPHEFHSYAGAGHAFLNDARPSYREDAARDAWSRCVRFLSRELAA